MDVRITSFSAFKSQPKTNFADKSARFSHLNELSTKKSKQLLHSPISTKKLSTKNLNDILISSKKTFAIEPRGKADKKGVLLYQQVEKNKLSLNGAELINRFHHKV